MSNGPGLVVTAPAKVNLTLEVLRRRPDGYHEIRSVMQAISLADRLTLQPAPDLTLRCDRPELAGQDNLVWRAAELLRRESGAAETADTIGTARRAQARGAHLVLTKRVPVAAGLGGGSADAAAALVGLNALWHLGLPRARLRELGAQLGSDVPFFLGESGCALAEGRGERLTPLAALPHRWLVLVRPPLAIRAGAVYGAFPPERWSDGARTRSWLAQAAAGGAIPAPFSDLEAVALEFEPAAGQGRAALLAAGAPHAVMSGSGPTYFAAFDTAAAAGAVHRRALAAGHEAYLAEFASLPITTPTSTSP